MKAKQKGEELVKVGYRLPPGLIERIKDSAVANRRSINDEVIVLLEESLERVSTESTPEKEV